MTEDKEFLTLDEIIHSDAAIDLELKALDKWVKVKNASTNDRIEAEKTAMLHPAWGVMSKEDKDLEIGKMLALRLLVEPLISYEDYVKSDDALMQTLLTAVSNEYNIKLAKLAEQHGHNVRRFLEQVLGEDLVNILSSLNSETTISDQPVESGEI